MLHLVLLHSTTLGLTAPHRVTAGQQVLKAAPDICCNGSCVLLLPPPSVHRAGGGRTGLVQAAWLVSSRGLEPQQAADAVMAHAASQGLSRRVDVQALQEFVTAAAGVQK